jgi:ABC-type sugar transport system ATPase subunit
MIYSNRLPPVLQVRNLSKSFDGIRALNGVSLEVNPGEVRALAGENGAGKSTLMKMIAGMYRPDSGDIFFKGSVVRLRSPHDALRIGISMIHQELMPFPDLTVAENICMGREPFWIDGAAMRRQARELLTLVGSDINETRKMRTLSVAQMQTVEIAKALGYQSELIIMDEPTSAISDREVESLLALILDLRSRGVAIIYISHRMGEISRIADSITVLRDGWHVVTSSAGDMNEQRMISLMAGRDISTTPARQSLEPGKPALEVRRLTRAGRFRDVSFTLHKGEIVGIAGLMGAGRTDLVSAIFGLAPADSGEIFVAGRSVHIDNPSVAMANRIALVTEDRKAFGLIPEMSLAGNITIANLRRYCRGPFVSRSAEQSAASVQIQRLRIRASSPEQKVKHLSGGNQQKAVLAKALLTNPSVLMLDEPTRGIDVGVKAELYEIIASLAREGKAILMISSELPEVLHLSDRILVMREGSVSAELRPGETNAEDILRHAMPQ